jgi:tetratricopeptide (TPR) repeat protein
VAGSMLQHADGSAESYVREMMQEGMDAIPEEQRTMAVLHWLFRRKALALSSPAREAWLALALHGMCLTRAEMLAACLGKEEAEIPPLMKLMEDRGLAIREMLPRQTGYKVEYAWRPAHALMSDWARSSLGKCGVDEAGVTARWMEYWSHVWNEELHWCYAGGDGAWHAFICTHLRTWLAHLELRAVPEKRLQAYRRCGQIYQMMGRLVEGLPCARQEVALANQLHGPEHRETLDANCELAWFVAHDDRGKAINMLQDLLVIAEEREGLGSPLACNARHTLASVLLLRKYRQDEARAIALLDENLAQTKEAGGDEAGKLCFSSLIQLGWYLYEKNHPDALAHFREVLERYPQDDHPHGRLRPDFVQSGAVLLDQAGFSDEALIHYQRAEAIFSKIPYCAEQLWALRGGIAERLAKRQRWEEAEAMALRQWEAGLSYSSGIFYQQEARDLLTAIQNRQLPLDPDEEAGDPA